MSTDNRHPSADKGGMRSPLRVVAVGGGTGLATLLTGLKRFTDQLTAVVTVTDEGGSSGRLRRGWGVLPPGDLRSCLVALAEDDTLLSRLFQYRFPAALSRKASRGPAQATPLTAGSPVGWSVRRQPLWGISVVEPSRNRAARERVSLEGHAFGNLFLTALSDVVGGLDRAMAAASQVLAVRGRVLPVSLEPVRLHALLSNGRRVLGETRIAQSHMRIRRVSLSPSSPRPSAGVLESISEADVVVLGPGSLYTSVIPPLLVQGVVEAIVRSRALKVYVCNVMTQPGETDGYSAADHWQVIWDHCRSRADGRPLVDVMLANSCSFPSEVLAHYRRFGSSPVLPPAENRIEGVQVVCRAMGPSTESLTSAQARHSPALLAKAVIGLTRRRASRVSRPSL